MNKQIAEAMNIISNNQYKVSINNGDNQG